MPRTYIKKSNKNRSYGYCDIKNLNRAVEAVHHGMSIRKAAIEYDVILTLTLTLSHLDHVSISI